MKKLFVLLSLIGIGCIATAQNKVIDKIVAQVGDKIILKSDVEVLYQQEAQNGPMPENIRCDILQQLIMQKLLQVQAVHDSVEVTDDEVEQELNSRIRYFENMLGSREKMEEFYGKTESQIKDEFRDQIRDLLLSQRMQDKITGDVTVSPLEVKAFYNKIPKDSLPYLNAEVEYAQITIIPEPTAEQKKIAKDKAENLRQRILKGEEFETIANSWSMDSFNIKNQVGGDLDCQTRGTFVPAFEAAAYKLKPGDISEVVETEFGYHIIKMVDRQGDKICLKHILIIPQVTALNINSAKQKLDSIRTQVKAGNLKFYDAANKYSMDEASNKSGGDVLNPQSGTTFFEISDLDPTVYYLIENLKPGDYSDVQKFTTATGKQGVRFILLKSETQPHIANLKDDYAKIQAACLNEKKQKMMMDWVEQRMKTVYLKVDPSYASCSEIQHLVRISSEVY